MEPGTTPIEKYRKNRALVTGGAGFLGSHLCDVLSARGESIVCVDSFLTGSRANIRRLHNTPQFKLIEHDVIEPLSFDDGLDMIFNLACAASPPRYQADPVHTLRTNVTGAINALDLAQAKGARIVQASTSEVYGDPSVHPQPESYHGNVNPIGPRACYDEGKRCAETLCFDYNRTRGTSIGVARIFNTYGPRMDPEDGRVVSNFISQALRGEALSIYGTGEQTRSFCYVEDLVAGLIALMDAGAEVTGPINLGNPVEFTMLELATLVKELTGSRSDLVFHPLPQDDPKVRRPDIGRAEALLGWQPTTDLETGLKHTIEWFDDALRRPVAAAFSQ